MRIQASHRKSYSSLTNIFHFSFKVNRCYKNDNELQVADEKASIKYYTVSQCHLNIFKNYIRDQYYIASGRLQ